MSFIWPSMLILLAVLPIFGIVYLRLLRRRRRFAAALGQFGSTAGAARRAPGLRRHIPLALFIAGLAIVVVALARPQALVKLPKEEGIVILAFDVSGSMAADDLDPNRMEAAKQAAQGFVLEQPGGVQIGVVTFSDSGFSVLPPTSDQESVLAAINRLAPQRGTSLAHGIMASLETIAEARGAEQPAEGTPEATPPPADGPIPAIIILLTDGENTSRANPLEAALESGRRGVRIYPIGVGSAAGANLEVEGFMIHTRLDEATLMRISEATGGEYFNAQTEQELDQIYRNISPEWVIRPEKIEITALFAGAGLLLFMIGGIFSLAWFSRLP